MEMDIVLYIILGQITALAIQVLRPEIHLGPDSEICGLEFAWDPNSDFCDLEFEFRVAKPTSRRQFA